MNGKLGDLWNYNALRYGGSPDFTLMLIGENLTGLNGEYWTVWIVGPNRTYPLVDAELSKRNYRLISRLE